MPDQSPHHVPDRTADRTAGTLTPRVLADRLLDDWVALDPVLATSLGLRQGADRFPDYSPDGQEATADLMRSTLALLPAAEAATADDDLERRCARLLRERLTAGLQLHEAGDGLRQLNVLGSPVHSVRSTFLQMPSATDEDWSTIAARMARVPEALDGARASLEKGRQTGLLAGPAQVAGVVEQLRAWGAGDGWFCGFAARGPEALQGVLRDGARSADAAVAGLADWLGGDYAAAASDGPDPVGRERYARWVRYWNGSDLDLDEAYAWGWQEYARLDGEMRAGAEQVLPGSTPRQAMTHLDEVGHAVDGVDEIRAWLQEFTDRVIATLDGVHFDLADPIKRVEVMIAPAGSAAAPYYTRPSLDFSRPGRTWLPTLGRERFPTWEMVSTWHHEAVPGHHLQLAQWVHVADSLSRYQTTIGGVSANLEGWALYAERLMDELGYLSDPGARLGFLDAQQMRAVRVVIDIGMHLGLRIPTDQGTPEAFHPGETWTPALAREFFGANSGRPASFLDSEIVRYLGLAGQAIGYKLGERAWLSGREAARAAHAARGETFDLKAWHMAALSQGSLGLDDLADELARL